MRILPTLLTLALVVTVGGCEPNRRGSDDEAEEAEAVEPVEVTPREETPAAEETPPPPLDPAANVEPEAAPLAPSPEALQARVAELEAQLAACQAGGESGDDSAPGAETAAAVGGGAPVTAPGRAEVLPRGAETPAAPRPPPAEEPPEAASGEVVRTAVDTAESVLGAVLGGGR